MLVTGKNETYHLSGSTKAQTLITAKRDLHQSMIIYGELKKIIVLCGSIKITERMLLELGIREPRTPDILPNAARMFSPIQSFE